MLTSLKRMIGMPVVWQDRQLGHVESVQIDAASRMLDGLVVRKGIGSARWCHADGILLVGHGCVLLSQKPGRIPAEQKCMLRHVYLTTGEHAGEVTDVIVHRESLSVMALEVSPGPLYRLLGRCAYARDYHADAAAHSAVTPGLLTWTQLLRQLGEEDDG